MPVVAYTGLPRSGKSYSVTEHVILPACKIGRVVYTNIPLNIDLIQKDYPHAQIVNYDIKEPVEDPQFWEKIPAGAIIVIDECWRYWASGLKAIDVPAEHKEFFAMHGHKVGENGFSQQIVLVTQDLAQIASFARQLVEETFRTTKLNAVGQNNKYRQDIYPGAQTGQNPNSSLRIREIFGSYKPEIYKYYKSHTMSETGSAGDETKLDTRGSLLKSFRLKAMLAFIVLAIPSTFFLWSSFADSYTEDYKAKEPEKAPQVDNRALIKTVYKAPEPKTRLSDRWRLVGYILGNKKQVAIIKSGSITRSIPLFENCTVTNVTTGYECTVDNEYITEYSGYIDQIDINPIKPSEQKLPLIQQQTAEADINIIEHTPRMERKIYHKENNNKD